jgi:hypothetical protein
MGNWPNEEELYHLLLDNQPLTNCNMLLKNGGYES